MINSMKKLYPIIFLITALIFLPQQVKASSLTNTSDTISVSTPSTSGASVKAMHTIKFTTLNEVPTSGRITITFPALSTGDANNPASASASTFQLNNLSDAKIIITGLLGAGTFFGTYTNPPSAGTFPKIELSLTGTTKIPAGTNVVIFLGCSAVSSSSCTASQPLIINPTKTAAFGNSDIWTIKLNTYDVTSQKDIDKASIKIATNPFVQVQANIEEALTFTISGIENNAPINNGNATGCTNTEFTTSGISSTSTNVDLGTLSNTNINITSQLITITTNAKNGYSLTATSNGHFTNPKTGSFINDSATAKAITTGKAWFGIHACGIDVPSFWGTGTTGAGSGAQYAWPTQTESLILASAAKGPTGNSFIKGSGMVSVEYAATIDNSIKGGAYSSVITYIVTPTF